MTNDAQNAVSEPLERLLNVAFDSGLYTSDLKAVVKAAAENQDEFDAELLGETHALIVALNGEIIYERYGEDFTRDTPLLSWSIAKSVLGVAFGLLCDAGLCNLDDRVSIKGLDARRITIRDLLQMRSGLKWSEDYEDGETSDVIDMLFGAGISDMAGYAASKPQEHTPGEHYYYSSGTTVILSEVAASILASHPEGYELASGVKKPNDDTALNGYQLLELLVKNKIFSAIGGEPNEVQLGYDELGSWVASSYLYTTARNFLSLGELYRNLGLTHSGNRVVSERWVNASVQPYSQDEDNGYGYGLHWWVMPATKAAPASYGCLGYDGQRIQVVPELGLSFVRFGKTEADGSEALRGFARAIVDVFAGLAAS